MKHLFIFVFLLMASAATGASTCENFSGRWESTSSDNSPDACEYFEFQQPDCKTVAILDMAFPISFPLGYLFNIGQNHFSTGDASVSGMTVSLIEDRLTFMYSSHHTFHGVLDSDGMAYVYMANFTKSGDNTLSAHIVGTYRFLDINSGNYGEWSNIDKTFCPPIFVPPPTCLGDPV